MSPSPFPGERIWFKYSAVVSRLGASRPRVFRVLDQKKYFPLGGIWGKNSLEPERRNPEHLR